MAVLRLRRAVLDLGLMASLGVSSSVACLQAQEPQVKQERPASEPRIWGLADREVKDNPAMEPNHGDLINQGLASLRGFQVDRAVEARKKALAGYVPEGQEVKVVFMYSVHKVVQGEEPEIKMLDDVYPTHVQTLNAAHAERTVEYEQEEVTIRGTGMKLKEGAPSFPSSSSNDQLGWIAWNQWRAKSSAWEENHRKETYMVAAPETTMRASPDATPQLDAAWIEQNRRLLGLSTEALRQRPDAQLAGMTDVLRALDARATGPSWSPKPGGILLSPEAAGKLGDGLTIDKVEYVPGSGEVRVTGNASTMGLDADLLATTLRLAFGYDQIPYFSLEPHESWDDAWRASRQQAEKDIRERLRNDPSFAAAFQQAAFEVSDVKGHRQRIAYLDQLDPNLAADVSARMPMDMDLVFGPKWLRRTRLGEMLFLADMSIKELWYGASVWSAGPSRALKVETHVPPKFWKEPNVAKEELERMLHQSIETSHMTRWWFTPGGQVGEEGNVLDLTQVQPVLQTERIGGTGKVSYDLDLGMGLKVHQEIVYDPFAPLVNQEDPWSKSVVQEVNHHFNDYAREFPEWEALRQVFRAYVFAIWLVKHDPDMGRRLLAQLPPPRMPDKPLPATWPDPQLLVVQMSEDGSALELSQTAICGGVGFEHDLLKATPGSVGGSMGSMASLPGGAGFSPNPIDDDVPATPEGYGAWRAALLRERGYLWGWVRACLSLGELWTFLGIAGFLALLSFWRARRKEKATFNAYEAGAITLDTAATALVFTLMALHPDLYRNHTAPFTAWWGGLILYTIGFIAGGRLGRFGMFSVVMFIVLIWTAITPGLGEVWRGFLPLHFATPALGAYAGAPLPTDVVYTLQAMNDGFTLGRSAEPRYALYLVLVILVVVGFWFDFKAEAARTKPIKA